MSQQSNLSMSQLRIQKAAIAYYAQPDDAPFDGPEFKELEAALKAADCFRVVEIKTNEVKREFKIAENAAYYKYAAERKMLEEKVIKLDEIPIYKVIVWDGVFEHYPM